MITRKLEKFISAFIRTSLAAKYGFLDQTHRKFLSFALIIYLVLLAWLSLMPASNFSNSLINFKGADKIVHGIIYLILAMLMFLPFIKLKQKSMMKISFIVFILASGYGLLMEFLQLWIRSVSRSFETGDIIANCIGVVTGIVLVNIISPTLFKNLP